MPLYYLPKQGDVLVCDFTRGFVPLKWSKSERSLWSLRRIGIVVGFARLFPYLRHLRRQSSIGTISCERIRLFRTAPSGYG